MNHLTSSKKNHYVKAILWFLFSLFVGCANDAIVQNLTTGGGSDLLLDHYTIAFYRLAISTLSLLPLLFFQRKEFHIPQYPFLHFLRGILTFSAIFLWISGIGKSSIVTATLVNFTMPIFAVVLTPLVLGEKRSFHLSIATSFGFLGTFITLYPAGIGINAYSTLFLFAVFCFLTLDLLAKKYGEKETRLNMIFYANLVALLCAFLPFYFFVYKGELPPRETWLSLGMMGVGGNLLLYGLLKAYQHAELTRLAPLRYLELVISLCFNYFLFGRIPTVYECVGALVIIPASLLLLHKRKG